MLKSLQIQHDKHKKKLRFIREIFRTLTAKGCMNAMNSEQKMIKKF